ncbi:MAG: hypothetical protein GY832_25665 [Chloroflexi bacterium]|nr:hypothetical protein [Chloroflexota bacterium]
MIGENHRQVKEHSGLIDDEIVAAGYTSNGSDDDVALMRYHGRYAVYLPLLLRD